VVETNPEYSALAMDTVEEAAIEVRELLKDIKEQAEKEGLECETIAHRGGDVHRHIIDDAKEVGATLIIMGRKGRTGIKRLMMGSVAEAVIGDAACDVLVVPREAGLTLNRILVATDGSERCEKAVRESIGLAKRSGSTLIAVSVARREAEGDSARENVRHVKELAEAEGLEVETITAVGVPYKNIVNTAKEKDADLIVVGRKGKTGIKRFFMGSNSERVIGLSDCAVLVV
jgi:nucleotide-binding universal stress UspA family protein